MLDKFLMNRMGFVVASALFLLSGETAADAPADSAPFGNQREKSWRLTTPPEKKQDFHMAIEEF